VDIILVTLLRRIGNLLVGYPFFSAVYAVVSKLDNRFDLDGDGKRERAIDELLGLGYTFGRRQVNFAVELALQILERKK